MRWRAEFNGYADPEHGNIVDYEDYAKLKAENETLRAAIVTPKVYVGVVSEIVEKDWAEQLKRAQAERDAVKARNKKLVEMLRGLEWVGDNWPGCPNCLCSAGVGHAPDCKLAALLKDEEDVK